MAYKIEVDGSSLVITDTVTGLSVFERPKRDYFFNDKQLIEKGRIEFYDTNGTAITDGVGFSKALADCVDVNSVVFTQATFLTFARLSLGFDTASGSGAIEGGLQTADGLALSSTNKSITDSLLNDSGLKLGTGTTIELTKELHLTEPGESIVLKSPNGTVFRLSVSDAGIFGVPPIPFTFSIDTTNNGSASNQFQLPLVSNGVISMDVDWGDGTTNTITSYNQAETLHTYASSGTYTVEILNEVRGWKFQNIGDKEKTLDISKWGEFNFTEQKTFYGCSNLTCSATDFPTLSTSSMAYAFLNCSLFNGAVSGWNLNNVTTMNGTFLNCTSFDKDISTLDVSSITDMQNMLNNTLVDQDLSGWDINQVTNFFYFMQNSHLSTVNYDALLIGWEAQAPSLNETPSFGTSQYTLGGAAEASRTSLINTYGWSITDGGGI